MIDEIKALVAEDYLEDAIKMLLEVKSIGQFSNDIILLSGRYKDLQKQIQRGAIGFEQAVIEKNNIRYTILGLLQELSGTSNRKNINKIELLIKRLSLLNGIMFRLIRTTLQIHKVAKILNYGSKPLQNMPKADMETCQGLEKDYLKVTYDLLFNDVRTKYYEECISILGKMSLEDEVLFEYYHYLSKMFRFYSEALNETIPWYFIAVYCVELKEDNNLLFASKKMLQALGEIYEKHGKNIEAEHQWISNGIGRYYFITGIEPVRNLIEAIEKTKIGNNALGWRVDESLTTITNKAGADVMFQCRICFRTDSNPTYIYLVRYDNS